MAQVNLTNTATHPLTLDFTVGHVTVRETIGVGATVDVGDRLTLDDVNQSLLIKQLIAANKLVVASVADNIDTPPDMPNQSLDKSNISMIMQAYLGQPVVATTNALVASVDWADGTLTIAAQPDCPRNVTVALTDVNNSITGGTLTITGKNCAGSVVTEVMSPDGLGGGKTLTGTKIFAKVDSVVIAGTTGAPLGGTDVVICGYGNVIGLPNNIIATTAVKHVFLGGARVTTPVLAAGVSLSGVDVSGSTYNGAKRLIAFYNVSE